MAEYTPMSSAQILDGLAALGNAVVSLDEITDKDRLALLGVLLHTVEAEIMVTVTPANMSELTKGYYDAATQGRNGDATQVMAQLFSRVARTNQEMAAFVKSTGGNDLLEIAEHSLAAAGAGLVVYGAAHHLPDAVDSDTAQRGRLKLIKTSLQAARQTYEGLLRKLRAAGENV